MARVEQQFLQFWASGGGRVAHWADSSYGALEEKDILKLATELDFPLVHFHSSYDGGLTCAGCDNHAGNAIPKPADVVLIEMGYNDDSALAADKVASKMRKQTWYRNLAEATSSVKFVVFLDQPTYRQMCPPKSKKQLKKWVKGTVVEGSKFTDEAMRLCQEELGIGALCLKGNSEAELFEGMLSVDGDGAVQNESTCTSYTSGGKDFSSDGQLALWEDSHHPTAQGAEVHFRSVVKAFKMRCEYGGFIAPGSAQPQSSAYSPVKQDWSNQAWNGHQASWCSAGYARSQPY